jgi:hypothetical protein
MKSAAALCTIVFLVLGLSTACKGSSPTAPTPTPVTYTVAITPTASTLTFKAGAGAPLTFTARISGSDGTTVAPSASDAVVITFGTAGIATATMQTPVATSSSLIQTVSFGGTKVGTTTATATMSNPKYVGNVTVTIIVQ